MLSAHGDFEELKEARTEGRIGKAEKGNKPQGKCVFLLEGAL